MHEDKQAIDTQQKTAGLIQAAYDKLKASEAESAAQILEQGLQVDFDDEEVKYALKCVHWWLERLRQVENLQDSFEKGGYILGQVKSYYAFLDRFDKHFDGCQYAVRYFVFSSALQHFNKLLGDGQKQHDPGLLLYIGRCYKGVGNYEEAKKYLKQALREKRDDVETIAELADVHALLTETSDAKVLFREAFFLDPRKVDLRSLESDLILDLCGKVKELRFGGPDLCEWVPIFGCILGVFNVKRELRQLEVGRLKQSIFDLEAELKSGQGKNTFIKPRLLNRYFWLIDYYENAHADAGFIEELLLKIRVVDPDIYKQYHK